MRFSEKALYHQIHPLKLATDIGAEIVSLPLFWQHWLLLALAAHFLPPILATAILMRFANLEWQRNSRFGNYVRRMMTRPVEAVRFAGDIVMVLGAWYHAPFLIAAGAGVVLLAWLRGVWPLNAA